jgi:hypothetical protein
MAEEGDRSNGVMAVVGAEAVVVGVEVVVRVREPVESGLRKDPRWRRLKSGGGEHTVLFMDSIAIPALWPAATRPDGQQ